MGRTEVVVAGHICLDLTPKFYTGGSSIAEVFRPGSLINVGPVTASTGGAVSNAGLALRRLGVEVSLMGKCGDDAFGAAVLDTIRAEASGAEAGMKVVNGETTSYTVVIAPPGIDRIFLHCPGANDTFTSEDVDRDAVAGARLLHFGYPPLMAKTYADGGAELARIFADARATGATTSLDLAYPDPASEAGRADWPGILARTLPYVDLFTPSIEELIFALRRERHDELVARAEGGDPVALINADLPAELADECISAGAAVVLIKCGTAGLYLRTAGRDRLAAAGRGAPADPADWADRELMAQSFRAEKVVSATGSGDSAISGFLAAVLRGTGPDEALRCAAAVGAQNVAVPDAVSGIRSWEETAEQIRSSPPLNPLGIELPDWREVGRGLHAGSHDAQP